MICTECGRADARVLRLVPGDSRCERCFLDYVEARIAVSPERWRLGGVDAAQMFELFRLEQLDDLGLDFQTQCERILEAAYDDDGEEWKAR